MRGSKHTDDHPRLWAWGRPRVGARSVESKAAPCLQQVAVVLPFAASGGICRSKARVGSTGLHALFHGEEAWVELTGLEQGVTTIDVLGEVIIVVIQPVHRKGGEILGTKRLANGGQSV